MGQFNASLRLPGDSKALAATVHIQEGRLQVASGEHVIGDWELAAIDISRIPEGIRVAAEGEVLLLDIADRAAFEEEAASLNGKAKRSGKAKKTPRTRAPRASTPRVAKEKPVKVEGSSRIDGFLERMKERFGSRLPDWVFTRKTLFGALALLVLSIVFARQVSYLLLIAGVIALLTGGVTMLDSVIARRILRHRVTPIQVVIGGGTVFVLGLLVGMVGNQLWG
ncbi:MAG TPA: hypothetical protein VIC07_08215 [Acidimicrobiia bacterium]|jgi:uncharacterized membrane protein YgdD (TMEM256/DUF423 family)